MSNYNIQVPWSGKDSLNDTDPDKVVSGGDFNTEFSAVKIAVNSKADLAGSASQAFSATTANPGTDTTQVASTAFVKAAITAGAITAAAINAIVYPVGSIYFNATSAENPAHAHAALVNMQHHASRLLHIHAEKLLEDVHDEFHRRVIVVEQKDAIEVRPLGLRLGAGNDGGAGAVVTAGPALVIALGQP